MTKGKFQILFQPLLSSPIVTFVISSPNIGTLWITKNRDEIGWNSHKVWEKGGLYG
jgi:hypothetical protein